MKAETSATYASKKYEFEMGYGVHIAHDTIHYAAHLLQEYGNELENIDAVELVERACRSLWTSLDLDAEESDLDWDLFSVDCAFTHATELSKEKSVASRRVSFPRARKELVELKRRWMCFREYWGPAVAQLRHESEKRKSLLRHLRRDVVFFMNKTKLEGYAEVGKLAEFLSLLSSVITQLQCTIHSTFKERLIVGPRAVAQVASSITGLPTKYFDWSFNLGMTSGNLKSKLLEQFIGLNTVIDKITRALSKGKSSMGPFGSFLFLGPQGRGRTKLARVLAEEIFGEKERFLKLDMSEYKEPDCLSRLLVDLARDKKYGSVVMFDNIEKAHSCCVKVLSQVLRDGKLTDGRGMSVNFSHDLVLVSSLSEVFHHCECLRLASPKIPFQELLHEPALRHPGESYNSCGLSPFYDKVANQFKIEFMDLFDDVVVFPWLSLESHMIISRFQMRDVATSMCNLLKKHVILYPSDAVLHDIMRRPGVFHIGARASEIWHKEYIEPMLYDVVKNDADDMLIIYIDAFLGVRDTYSFRVEKSKHLEKSPTHKRFMRITRKLRNKYRREKLQVNKMYRLQTIHFHLFELMQAKPEVNNSSIVLKCKEIVQLIDDLLMNGTSRSNEFEQVQRKKKRKHSDSEHVSRGLKNSLQPPEKATSASIQELVQVDEVNGELGCGGVQNKRKHLKRVSRRLKTSLQQRDKATQAIIQPLLKNLNTFSDDKSIKYRHMPASCLCLGLTPLSRKKFVKSLRKHLGVSDGKRLLLEVDLSLCTEPDSFFRCACTMDNHLLLTEAVKECPLSVIVFHHLEMAHISVFSTILSILDDGVSKDNDGSTVSFRNFAVVIISDLGNMDIIARLNGNYFVADPIKVKSTSKGEREEEVRGLRSELMSRLDQLLLFDPCSRDQLNQFAKLPWKSLKEKSNLDLNTSCFDLFGNRPFPSPDAAVQFLKKKLSKMVIVR